MPALRLAFLQDVLYSASLFAGRLPNFARPEELAGHIFSRISQQCAPPKAPNAPAIYLFREVDRDDTAILGSSTERIKILISEEA